MKLESDKHVVCDGSCNECVCVMLRLYLWDAEVWEVLVCGGRG